jgi:hypothetical protein
MRFDMTRPIIAAVSMVAGGGGVVSMLSLRRQAMAVIASEVGREGVLMGAALLGKGAGAAWQSAVRRKSAARGPGLPAVAMQACDAAGPGRVASAARGLLIMVVNAAGGKRQGV